MRESVEQVNRRAVRFSPIEIVLAIVIVAVILAVLLPLLHSARIANDTSVCAHHQKSIFVAWQAYMDDHDSLPLLIDQPGWRYGGVRFSSTYAYPYLDYSRPLNRYMLSLDGGREAEALFQCPSDAGIVHEDFDHGDLRTAYEAFGTSYRANRDVLSTVYAGLSTEHRQVRLAEITANPSRLLLMGDAFWREHIRDTGRTADWHGHANAGNLLLFDGSVRFVHLDAGQHDVQLSPVNN